MATNSPTRGTTAWKRHWDKQRGNSTLNLTSGKRFSITLLLLTGCLFLGCKPAGPPVATVKGKVTLKGTPITAGFVIFQSEDGARSTVADINAEGKYEMRTHEAGGIAPGKYKVAFKPPAPGYTEPPLADAGQRDPRPVDKTIPERYYSVETSGITVDVTLEEKKSYDFDLQR
jgi:hypothetical protein